MDIKKQDHIDRQRKQFIPFDRNEEMGFVTLLSLQYADKAAVIRFFHRQLGFQLSQFTDRFTDVALPDRLQQIIDAVHLKSTQGIFIISGRKDDRTGDIDMLEYFKRRTVGQMNIQEDQFRHRIGTKPFDTFSNTIQHGYDLYVGSLITQERLQIANGRFLVFND